MRNLSGSCRASMCAAVVLVLMPTLAPVRAGTLSLMEAFQRVSETHPELARFAHERVAGGAEVEQARQRPAFELGLEVENVPGNGDLSGAGAAELTLSLASVLELGGKRAARISLAQARASAIEQRQEARRLDLMAEVARRFLDALAAQVLERIAAADVSQRERTIAAAAYRVETGAEPVSARLAAEAAAARARLQLTSAGNRKQIAVRRLAILWGERMPDFQDVAGDPLNLPAVPGLDTLLALLERSPELEQFAHESRLREARLQLARSARSTDLSWQLGVRRLEASDDWAAVATVSVPIGRRASAEPSIRVAQSQLSALELEREGEELALHATLVEAYGRLRTASIETSLGRDEVLPRLAQAQRAAGHAYRAGALSYLDWAQIQADIVTTQREQLQAALEAHRALIEIQRLTGDPFLAGSASSSTERKP